MNKLYTLLIASFLFALPHNVIASDRLTNLSEEDFLKLVQTDLFSNSCKNNSQFIALERLNNEPEAAYYVATCAQQQRPLEDATAARALELLELSVKAGNADAANQLTTTYSEGYGVEVDHLKAMDWTRKSWSLTKNISYFEQIFLLVGDDLKPSSFSELYDKLEIQAKSGDAEAQYRYATIIEKGKRKNSSIIDAIFWYKKSADNGYENANFTLGYLYCRGIGVDANKVKSNSYFELSNRNLSCF